MKISKILVMALFSSLFILAACGGGEPAAPAADVKNSIEVDMNDIFYGAESDNAANPPVWTVSSGTNIRVRANNIGALEHNFAVVKLDAELPTTYSDEQNGEIILQDTGLVAPGDSSSVTLQAFEPGEYVVICTVAGHFPAMQGKLVVEE